MFSKAASEGGRQEDRKRKDRKTGREGTEAVRREGTEDRKRKDRKTGREGTEAVRREGTKRKDPLIQITNSLFLRHYDKYNIYIL